jgi:hypothetical protein
VEHYAKVVLAARQIGQPCSLDRREVEKLTDVRARYRMNGH